jgi:hypothetical protein
MVVGTFPKFRNEVDVFDVVAVIIESMNHLVFDVFVENESIDHPSGVRVPTYHHTTLSVVFQDPSFTNIRHPSKSDLPSMTTLPLPTRGIPHLYVSEFDWLDTPDFK